mmetsp:Transcript_29512/g.85404  ORF Transcript_29512/g.85404 Transcript_29512/m.85404 type:complete len:83 (-) Transcript_29512:432-680(-)
MCDRWFIQETDRQTDRWTKEAQKADRLGQWTGVGLVCIDLSIKHSLISQHEKSDITASMASRSLPLSLTVCVCLSACVTDPS